jgi:hypothetical protein
MEVAVSRLCYTVKFVVTIQGLLNLLKYTFLVHRLRYVPRAYLGRRFYEGSSFPFNSLVSVIRRATYLAPTFSLSRNLIQCFDRRGTAPSCSCPSTGSVCRSIHPWGRV